MTFVGINDKIYFDDNLNVGIGITNPSTNFHIDSTDGIVIPVGTTVQRVDVTGAIRYNTDISTFEGFKGTWGSLGGVIDVDQDTYVSAETSAGTDNDQLKFVTAGTERMVIDSSGNTTINSDLIVDTNLLFVDASSDLVNINGTLDVWGKFHVDSNAIYAENSIIALGNTLTGPIIDSQGTNIRLTPNSSYIGALTIDASGDTSLTGNLSMNDNNIININNIDFSSATIKGHMIPDTDDAYDIGSAEFKIRELYVSDNSLWVGDAHKVSISSTGKMKFRKRKVSSVPAAVAAADGTENGAKSHSGMGSLADMKLKHWRAYMRTLPGQGSARIQDIFRDNDDDYDEQASADNWLENGTKTYCNIGNVGIGTDDPDYKLDVNGSVQLLSDKAVVFDSGGFGGNGNSTDLYFNKGDVGFNQSEFVMYNQNDNNASGRYFAMAYSTAGNETGLNINIANNVGIGTTDPSALLHLTKTLDEGGSGMIDMLRIEWDDAGSEDTQAGDGTKISFGTSSVNNSPASVESAYIGAIRTSGAEASHNTDLVFGTKEDDSTDISEKMRIRNTGYVGIGINPSSILNINTGSTVGGNTKNCAIKFNNYDAGARFVVWDNGTSVNDYAGLGKTFSALDICIPLSTNAFVFKAAGAELMRINGYGNVGIGTNNPVKLLEIHDSVHSTSLKIVQSNSSLRAGMTLRHDNAGDMNIQLAHNGTLIQQNYAGGDFTWYNTTAELMRLENGGNVGIGTYSPSAKLCIQDGGIHMRNGMSNGDTRPDVTTVDNTSTYEIRGVGGGSGSNVSSDDGFLRLRAGGGSNTSCSSHIDLSGYNTNSDMDRNITFTTYDAERMRIDINGKVGIGNTSPEALLHLGNVEDTEKLLYFHTERPWYVIQGESGSGATLDWMSTNGGKRFRIIDEGTGNIVFTAQPNTTAANQRVFLCQDGGNVGIGTDNPGYKLDVSGDISLTGNFRRYSYETGCLVGGHGIINGSQGTSSSYYTNPIYTIGQSYMPTETSLSGMYGIGYSHSNASFLPGDCGWGMYVTANGEVGSFLSGATSGESFVMGKFGIGTNNPQIALAIGDGDTGFQQQGDGELAIYTNNSERVRIDNTGRVGIGTNNPLIHLAIGDSDTGFQQQGDGKLAIYTNSGERVRIDNAGNVGIGVTDPACKLEVGQSGGAEIRITDTSNSNSIRDQGSLTFWDNDASGGTDGHVNARITCRRYNTQAYPRGELRFDFNYNYSLSGQAYIKNDGDLENTNNRYGNISDERLKENIVDCNSQWDDIKNIRFRKYNFKNKNRTMIGVIAQELEQTSPGLVSTREDGDIQTIYGVEINKCKSVASSIMYMKGMKALQESMLRIEELEKANENLVTKNQTLERNYENLLERIIALENN